MDKNDNNINNIANNQHQLEILACDETLRDFEEYLLERGFDEMIECVVSNNENERQNFSYFFKYFGRENLSFQKMAKIKKLVIIYCHYCHKHNIF